MAGEASIVKKRRGEFPFKTIRLRAGAHNCETTGGSYKPPTESELGVVLDLYKGKTCRQISQERGGSEAWASHQLQNCMLKMGAHSEMELFHKLMLAGYIQAETLP